MEVSSEGLSQERSHEVRQVRVQLQQKLWARAAANPPTTPTTETEEEDVDDAPYAHDPGAARWEPPQPSINAGIGCWCEGDSAVCDEGQHQPLFRKYCQNGCSGGECD